MRGQLRDATAQVTLAAVSAFLRKPVVVAACLLALNTLLASSLYPDLLLGTSGVLVALLAALYIGEAQESRVQPLFWGLLSAVSALLIVYARDPSHKRCGMFESTSLAHLCCFHLLQMMLVPATVGLVAEKGRSKLCVTVYLAGAAIVLLGMYSHRPWACTPEARMLRLPFSVRIPGEDEYRPVSSGDWAALEAGVDTRKLQRETFHYLEGQLEEGEEVTYASVGPSDVCKKYDLRSGGVLGPDGKPVGGLLPETRKDAVRGAFSEGEEVSVLSASTVQAKGRAPVEVTFVYEGERLSDATKRVSAYLGKPFFVHSVSGGEVALRNARGKRVKLAFKQPSMADGDGPFQLMEVKDGSAQFGRGFALQAYEVMDRHRLKPGDTVHVTAEDKLLLPNGRTYTVTGRKLNVREKLQVTTDGSGNPAVKVKEGNETHTVPLPENRIVLETDGEDATATALYYGVEDRIDLKVRDSDKDKLQTLSEKGSLQVTGIHGGCVQVSGETILQQVPQETRSYQVPVRPPVCKDARCRRDRHFVLG